MANHGDIAAGATLDFKFNTATTSGAPITLAGTPSLVAYKANSTTQDTDGLTLSVDFDSVTGLHNVRVDTSADGTFYAAGSNIQIVLAAGTVNGISVVGYVVGEFSIAARPVQGLASGVLTATAIASDAITAAKVAADVTTELQSGLATASALSTLTGYVDTEVAAIKAKTDNLPSDPADASVVAGLIAAVETKVDTVDSNVDAIKAKTDSLTFSTANQVDANIQYVNDVEVAGDGDGTPWGPA